MAAMARVLVSMTADEKQELKRRAAAANLSPGEYLRRAGLAFRADGEEALLEAALALMLAATEHAEATIDDALAYCEKSNRRIAAMEKKR